MEQRPGPTRSARILVDVCGRYVSAAARADLAAAFEVAETVGEDPGRSWNVAPTDPVRVVTRRHPHGVPDGEPVRQLRTVRWGLVPSWSKTATGAARMINARVETVTAKPAFRTAAVRRRCLVPADGYYEWQRAGGRKVPHYLRDPDGGLLAFAGLYELWRDPAVDSEGGATGWLWSCAVLTRPAADVLGHIHDRCPVIVPGSLQERWLDCHDDDTASVERLLGQVPEPRLEPVVVGSAVGNVRNNGPELITPVAPVRSADLDRLPS